jgi:probable rRNA maturation factor
VLERRLAAVARRVLGWEGAHRARVELTMLDAAAMRRLNRRAKGRRALTDVLAFALPQPDGTLVGDVYLCRAAAERFVSRAGAGRGAERIEEEMVRLAVHGTLHVLGYDHPEGSGRTRSAMWRRQERYVRRLHPRGAVRST